MYRVAFCIFFLIWLHKTSFNFSRLRWQSWQGSCIYIVQCMYLHCTYYIALTIAAIIRNGKIEKIKLQFEIKKFSIWIYNWNCSMGSVIGIIYLFATLCWLLRFPWMRWSRWWKICAQVLQEKKKLTKNIRIIIYSFQQHRTLIAFAVREYMWKKKLSQCNLIYLEMEWNEWR